MNIILLSGGSGKRLWPLSNDIRSKQFIKIFNEDDTLKSMVQRIYGQIKTVDKEATVTIATSSTQVSAIHNQLGDVGISVEPCRRDTFPAIALSTAYLVDVCKVDPSEAVVVCPVDPYVDLSYFEAVKRLCDRAKESEANLVLMGIKPDHPSEKFGYIIPGEVVEGTDSLVKRVSEFKEKPDVETAKRYLAQGAMWNGGVFAYRLSYVLNKAHELIDFKDYNDLFEKYDTLTKISFDYAVVEKEDYIEVMEYSGEWKDLGTWNSLCENLSDNVVGEGIVNSSCENVHIVNETNMPIIAMGLKDVVIAASADGILVADKEESAQIKSIVDGLNQPIMYAEEEWGNYRILDIENGIKTIKLTVNAGKKVEFRGTQYVGGQLTVISGDGRYEALNSMGVFNGDSIVCTDDLVITAESELKIVCIR